MMKPFVKWAGGKRQILDEILKLINIYALENNNDYTYIEPFVGGGAVFLALNHDNVIINDSNTELINAYNVIRNNPVMLMKHLDELENKYLLNNEETFYKTRELDRDEKRYNRLSDVEKAARTIFLNKTCFNGLYRVNLKGQFNTPMGRYKNPLIYDKKNIMALSSYFNNPSFEILNGDYSVALKHANANDIIYVDPPYDYGEDGEGFTKYQKEGFEFEDFIKLKIHLDEAINKGAFVIISNNATERVIDLFEKDPNYQVIYNMKTIETNRTINSKGNQRKTGSEVLIMGSPVTFPQANSIEKVMRLVRLRKVEHLKDTNKLKELLDVKTYRQVHYYTTALRFLNLTDLNNEYSEQAKEFRMLNRAIFEKSFAAYILTFNPFEEINNIEKQHQIKLNNNEIAHFIKKHYDGYSYSTYVRRASTVRKWLNWCEKILV